MDIANWIRRNAPTILTFAGGVGFVATVIFAVKATPKASEHLEEARKGSESGDLTILETVKACGKDYIPTILTGAGSLACFFGANALNAKQQETMMAAYAGLDGLYRGYRRHVKRLAGDKEGEVLDAAAERAAIEEIDEEDDGRPPWDEPQTFYIELCGKSMFFDRSREDVEWAEYQINRDLAVNGIATVNDFLNHLNLAEDAEEGDKNGWDLYCGAASYGYNWIDFSHRFRKNDDGMLVCEIEMPAEPHPLFQPEI